MRVVHHLEAGNGPEESCPSPALPPLPRGSGPEPRRCIEAAAVPQSHLILINRPVPALCPMLQQHVGLSQEFDQKKAT